MPFFKSLYQKTQGIVEELLEQPAENDSVKIALEGRLKKGIYNPKLCNVRMFEKCVSTIEMCKKTQ